MFKNNLVMVVKVNGEVLREFDSSHTVALPFGSEYSIFIRNLSSQRASVKLSIDGSDALDGTSVLVNGGSTVELKRFIKNGNFDSGNAFKFIEKTEKIEKFRGNKAEDGLVTLTYEFEREIPKISTYPQYTYTDGHSFSGGRGALRSMSKSAAPMGFCDTGPVANYSSNVAGSEVAFNNATLTTTSTSGVTAPGSVVEQKFTSVYGFIGDGKRHTMTLKLEGLIEGQIEVTRPVTVKRKVQCIMCGTTCKQTAKFCHECSAGLPIA